MSITASVPWQAKLVAKVILSRLPVSYKTWRRFHIFGLGGMDRFDYAYGVFTKHFRRSTFGRKSGSFTALEIGPGDSLLSAVLAKAFGAERSYLIDAGNFAHAPLAAYVDTVSKLQKLGYTLPVEIERCQTIEEILGVCGSQFRTGGLDSLRDVPSGSVDFIWSHTVLQHISLYEFDRYLMELRRVLRDDGVCSHRIDLKDMMAESLNHLRFSETTWEKPWMARSGFYSNRLRYSELLRRFVSAGFTPEVIDMSRWEQLPVPRKSMSPAFAALGCEELQISGFDVLLHPA